MRKRTKKSVAVAAAVALCMPLSACGTYTVNTDSLDVLSHEKTQTSVVDGERDESFCDNSVSSPVLPVPNGDGSATSVDISIPDMNAEANNEVIDGVSVWDGDLKKAGWGSETRVAKPDGFKSIARNGVLEIEIESAEALAYLSHEIYAYNAEYLGCRVKLGCDIDLKNQLWIPIGFDNRDKKTLDHAFKGKIEEATASEATETGGTLKAGYIKDGEKYYKVTNAVFDANGHTIKNLDGNAFVNALNNNVEDGTIYLKYGDLQLDVEVNHDHKHNPKTTTSGIKYEEAKAFSAKIEFHYGLFDVVANAEIKDLTVENFKFNYPEEKRVKSQCNHTYKALNEDQTGTVDTPCGCQCTYVADSVGAIVGYAGGGLKLVNCTAGSETSDKTETDNIIGTMCSGGLVGRVYGNCDYSKMQYGTGDTFMPVVIEKCTNYITVGDSNDDKRGGIVGYINKGSVSHFLSCENYGNIMGQYAGGMVSYMYYGNAEFVFDKCTNYGNIAAIEVAGGMAGKLQLEVEWAERTIGGKKVSVTGCKNYGAIRALAKGGNCNTNAGGIVGWISSYINKDLYVEDNFKLTDCFNYGDVIGIKEEGFNHNNYLGGLVGGISNLANKFTVSGGNCGKIYLVGEATKNDKLGDGCIGNYTIKQGEGALNAIYLINAYKFPETEGNNK